MQSTAQVAGECPKCKVPSLSCRFNYFDRGDLQIHSWEHRCPDCGWRETKAFRSDAPEAGSANPAVCPWCGRVGSGA